MGNICNGKTTTHQLTQISQSIIPTPVHQNKILSKNPHEPSPKFATVIQNFPELQPRTKAKYQQLSNFYEGNSSDGIVDYQSRTPNQDERVYRLSNGTIYQGEWYNGSIHGKGRFYLADHSYLECYCVENSPIGKARLITPRGDYYQGGIKDGIASGQGRIVIWEPQIQYSGYFEDNYLHGEGYQKGFNYSFQGIYDHGRKVTGTLKWSDQSNQNNAQQSKYVGQFENQLFNGKGVLENQIGKFEGTFLKGMKDGYGTFLWKNGAKFDGQYQRNIKNGEGKMYNPKGQLMLQGAWKNDKPPSALESSLK